MTALSERSALRRFLLLTALRWLPGGLLIPVAVLLPLARGLTLTQLGLAASMQGLVVLFLELPTGGLADTIGRRRVLLAAMVFGIASIGLLLVADTFLEFAISFALAGVYRALDSGPLEAWYVDAAHAANPAARIERGMGAQGTVLGLAIGAGALASSGLIAWNPVSTVDPMTLVVAACLSLMVVKLMVTSLIMAEHRSSSGIRAVLRSTRDTGRTIAEGVGLLRGSRVLLALVCVELFWSFGMVPSWTALGLLHQ